MNEANLSNMHALVRDMPKVMLHEHLDGGLRPATLLALLRRQSRAAPATDEVAMVRWLDGRAHAGSLEAYLEGFGLTVSAMADVAALTQVAKEAAEDARHDGCIVAEFRIAPALFEAYGISIEAAIEALVAGLSHDPLPSGLIVCAMRHHRPEDVMRSAQAAIAHRERGVIGFDLAGPEAGFPPALHAEALRALRDAGVPLTLHAGEADAGERVFQAIALGARRIGHGVRLVDCLDMPACDAEVAALRQQGIHLEVCVTSNVHTGAAPSVSQHPIRALWDAGVELSFHTDNRLISGVTMSGEAALLVEALGFDIRDLLLMQLHAAQRSFLPQKTRQQAVHAIVAWAASHGIALPEGAKAPA